MDRPERPSGRWGELYGRGPSEQEQRAARSIRHIAAFGTLRACATIVVGIALALALVSLR